MSGGRGGKDLVTIQARARVVGAQHVDHGDRVGRGRHSFGVERPDLRCVLEYGPQLRRELLRLLVAEPETGKLRHVLDILLGDQLGHGRDCRTWAILTGGSRCREDGSMQRRKLTPQGEERKAELLSKAAELFAERGYSRTRVSDIVKAAGVAKGLFYWYFDNKDALFNELIEDTSRKLRGAQADAVESIDDPLERIYLGTMASVQFVAEHHRLYALMQAESAENEVLVKALRSTSELYAANIAAILRDGQKAGVVRSDDSPELLAWGVLGTVSYFAYFQRFTKLSTESLSVSAARYVLRAIAANEAAANAVEPRMNGARK